MVEHSIKKQLRNYRNLMALIFKKIKFHSSKDLFRVRYVDIKKNLFDKFVYGKKKKIDAKHFI